MLRPSVDRRGARKERWLSRELSFSADRQPQVTTFLLIFVLLSLGCQAEGAKDSSMDIKKQYQNRLINEKSPYLLQHADNPVDWYPWGRDAFEKARKEDKPIFLSIGYSTCHWCHVMEHESFENEEIAQMINHYFVAVKVDREERPDIDHVYMSAVTAMTGQGGWPLTVFLTPEGQPFFGGTYFPPYPKWGSPGLVDALRSISDLWQNDRARVLQSSGSLAAWLSQRPAQTETPSVSDKEVFSAAYRNFSDAYDSQFGGFGFTQKFPSVSNLYFLLRYGKRSQEKNAVEMVERTLDQMSKGGIRDHIGGGFHRYATDRQWRVPHFEKMLYDQALLARIYLEAYQATHKESYARVAREIFDYVLQNLKQPAGGFYSSEDADSLDPNEGMGAARQERSPLKKEGAFYVWRHDEIKKILGEDDSKFFNYHFGIKAEGNVSIDPLGEFQGKNILYIDRNLEETAEYFKTTIPEAEAVIRRCQARLAEVRENRPRPFLDDKILVDGNGLMISSLAFGSRVLREPRYRQAAQEAADFIFQRLLDSQGRLLHRYRDGDSAISATLDDYAFYIYGLLDIYEAGFDVKYLKHARDLAEEMIVRFWDEKQGGFYLTAKDAEELLFRPQEARDGALPSGNSMAALDMIRLYHMTLDQRWEDRIEKFFQAFSGSVSQNPSAYAQALTALDFFRGPSQEIVIAGRRDDQKLKSMVETVYQYFIPNKVILFAPAGADEKAEIVSMAPFLREQIPSKVAVTVYVCENHICKLPVTEMGKLHEILKGLR